MFAIIGAPRTGTEAVSSALNAHPDVTCMPEPFHSDPAFRERVHAHFIGRLGCPIWNGESVDYLKRCDGKFPAFGVKMLYSQCSSDLIDYLSDFKIIHMVRPVEDSYRSLALAEASGVFHLVDKGSDLLELGEAYSPIRLGVPATECKSSLKEFAYFVERWRTYIRSRLPAENVLEINDLSINMKSIQEFLGIRFSPKAVPQTHRG